jgi:hypothetical protein
VNPNHTAKMRRREEFHLGIRVLEVDWLLWYF